MKLKHYGYVLAAGAALAAIMAFATTARAEEDTDRWSYTCIPDDIDQSEWINGVPRAKRDPVVRVRVKADFAGGDEWKLTSLYVIHETYKGRKWDRGEQYNNAGYFGRLKPDAYMWVWNGIKKDDPHHIVSGGLFYSPDNKWHYSERHEYRIGATNYKEGKKVKESWIHTTCNEAIKNGSTE